MEYFKTKLPISTPFTKLIPLIIPITVLMLSDAVLSYSVPIYAQEFFSNDFLSGLIISFSSVIGLLFDYLSRRFFGNKNFAFFIKCTFIFSIIFSYSLGLSFVNKYIFIFAMAAWGIYYETLAFSNFKYLKHYIENKNYTISWAFISMLKAFVYAIGPLIATFLISIQFELPTYITGTAVLGFFLLYMVVFPNKPTNKTRNLVIESQPELRVWFVLLKRIYPLWLLNLTLIIIDASFWTVGILMAESLGKANPMAKLLLPAYMLPVALFSPLSQIISSKFGKKRTAMSASLIGSMFLIGVGISQNVASILLSVIVYSIFTALTFPAIYAAFEDYIKRLGNFETDFIGLEQSSTSLAYIIGPIFAGFISSTFSEQKVFLSLGILLAVVSLFALIVTPKKIKMPQSELLKAL